MQILHHVTTSWTPELRDELVSLGLRVDDGSDSNRVLNVITFKIDESHPAWSRVQQWILTQNAVDFVETRFSETEISNAKWLELVPQWHHGYPQPREDEFGYLSATYDLSKFCRACGSGKKQKAPFQMRGEPKWGSNSVLQLNWVFDEFFVTPDLWSNAFRMHGIDCCPVLSLKQVELKSVVQLVINELSEVQEEALESEICQICSRKKYAPVKRGPFPPLKNEPASDITKTVQYFGTGAAADRRIIVSQKWRAAFVLTHARGVSFRPVMDS